MGILRFYLASAVLLTHAQATVMPLGGSLAVSAFYVISGFYMQLLFAEKFTRGEVLSFYKSRALRIFPLYYVFLVLTLPFIPEAVKAIWTQGNLWTRAFMVFEHLALFGQDLARFTSIGGTIVGQSWSLAVEFGFYAIAPFLLTKPTRTLICTLAASIAARAVITSFDPDPWNFGNSWYAFLPSEIGTFLLGSLAYRYYSTRALIGAGPYMLACLVAYGLIVQEPTFVDYFGFVLLVAIALPFIFAWTRDSKVDRWIGELSYPIYLGHIFVMSMLALLGISSAPWTLVVTVALAMLLARYVETPIARYRHVLAAGLLRPG